MAFSEVRRDTGSVDVENYSGAGVPGAVGLSLRSEPPVSVMRWA